MLNEPLADELGPRPRLAAQRRRACGCWSATSSPTAPPRWRRRTPGTSSAASSPRLGDGRALLLGELVDADGRLRDLHLKGSGRTPFARGGDGLAAVGPMLREYVVSEAMHALGIPTTRSLAVVATGRPVRRETLLPGAVLARVASSHLRVGSFQYARATGDLDLLRRLADHAIARHHPQAAAAEHPYLALFEAVVAAQASLVARWMLVGFVHGVMNTDNMTISGETIDYGPCAFMDAFDPATVYSSIDHGGRYAYGNQPVVAEWNLARLAEALLPLFARRPGAGGRAGGRVARRVPAAVRRRLVGRHARPSSACPTASTTRWPRRWWTSCSPCSRADHVDYTSFFRDLGAAARGDAEPARGLFLDLAGFDAWLARWRALGPDAEAMDRVNPVYIPRNHLVEEALAAAAAGDLDPLHGLARCVAAPFDERPGLERYAAPAPVGLRRLPDLLRHLRGTADQGRRRGIPFG